MYRLLILSCLVQSFLVTEEILTYEKISGKGTQKIVYNINKDKNTYIVEIEGKDQKTTLKGSNPFSLTSYATKKKGDSYEFVLEGSKIQAKGNVGGQSLTAEFSVNQKNPWIQEFDFGMQPLLSSSKSQINFQLINPKNFKMHKMVAKKFEKETLKIHDTTYQAILVEVSLQGFKSMFWKAQIWYDAKTYDLLQYKSNEGPNTPTTTVTLVSKVTKSL